MFKKKKKKNNNNKKIISVSDRNRDTNIWMRNLAGTAYVSVSEAQFFAFSFRSREQ